MREHDTSGTDCWCGPEVREICPECGDEPETPPDCWRCGGEGTVPCPAPELYDGPYALMIVHRAEDDQE